MLKETAPQTKGKGKRVVDLKDISADQSKRHKGNGATCFYAPGIGPTINSTSSHESESSESYSPANSPHAGGASNTKYQILERPGFTPEPLD